MNFQGIKWQPPSGKPHNNKQLTAYAIETRKDLDELGGTLLPKLSEGLEYDLKQARTELSLRITRAIEDQVTLAERIMAVHRAPWYRRWWWLLGGKL